MAMLPWVVVVVVVVLIDKRTWVLCWTLLATIGLMASSRSSFRADAAMVCDAMLPRLIVGVDVVLGILLTHTNGDGRVSGRALDSAEQAEAWDQRQQRADVGNSLGVLELQDPVAVRAGAVAVAVAVVPELQVG